MGRLSEFNLCRTSAFVSAEAVPKDTENDFRKYQIVYRMASQQIVTERPREGKPPNGIARDSHRMPL